MDKQTVTLVEIYAQSLVDVAVQDHLIAEIKQDLRSLLEVFQSTDLGKHLSHQGINHAEKAALIDQLQKDSHVFVTNLLKVIVQNQRESLLEPILRLAEERLSTISNAFALEIQVATALSDEQRQRLKKVAEKKFNLTVDQIIEVINADLIGGFILTANHKIIDTSIKSQLQQLKMNLK